jgi:hypothetical protein
LFRPVQAGTVLIPLRIEVLMRTSLVLLLLVALGLCTVPTVTVQARQAAAGVDVAKAQSFLKQLQTAVAIDNRLKVASMFSYPAEVWAGGRTITIKGDSDLQANYSKVFDSALKQAIASATVETLSTGDSGLLLDKGRVVIAPVGSKLKVTRIAEPQN